MQPVEVQTLTKEDIINTMRLLIKVFIGEENVDDIDHLGNRRIRSVGRITCQSTKDGIHAYGTIGKGKNVSERNRNYSPTGLDFY